MEVTPKSRIRAKTERKSPRFISVRSRGGLCWENCIPGGMFCDEVLTLVWRCWRTNRTEWPFCCSCPSGGTAPPALGRPHDRGTVPPSPSAAAGSGCPRSLRPGPGDTREAPGGAGAALSQPLRKAGRGGEGETYPEAGPAESLHGRGWGAELLPAHIRHRAEVGAGSFPVGRAGGGGGGAGAPHPTLPAGGGRSPADGPRSALGGGGAASDEGLQLLCSWARAPHTMGDIPASPAQRDLLGQLHPWSWRGTLVVPTCQEEAAETPMPGSVRGQIERGPEQLDLVSGISARGRGLERHDFKALSNPHHSTIQVKCVLRSAKLGHLLALGWLCPSIQTTRANVNIMKRLLVSPLECCGVWFPQQDLSEHLITSPPIYSLFLDADCFCCRHVIKPVAWIHFQKPLVSIFSWLYVTNRFCSVAPWTQSGFHLPVMQKHCLLSSLLGLLQYYWPSNTCCLFARLLQHLVQLTSSPTK